MPLEPLSDTWASRDLPVLRAAAKLIDNRPGDIVQLRDLMAELDGMDETDVARAVLALNGTYLHETHNSAWGGEIVVLMVTDITERGRRAVGLWPSGETAESLIDALRQAEQATSDPAEQSRIRQATGALMALSRDLLIDVTASVIARQTGLG